MSLDLTARASRRIIEFAKREQAMHRQNGVNLSLTDVLQRNGIRNVDVGEKGTSLATGDQTMQQLRMYVPPAMQTAMGLCLTDLKNGTLKILAAAAVPDNQLSRIKESLAAAKVRVDDLDVELVNRAELVRVLRNQDEVPAERLERLFSALSNDPNNLLVLEQAFQDLLAEALQSRASDIHLSSMEDDSRCWIKYRIDGEIVMKHLIPARVMAPLVTRIKTDAKMDAADRARAQDGRLDFIWQQRPIDVRVAYVPIAPAGEKLTLRLLDVSNLKTFEDLFADYPEVSARIETSLNHPIKDGGILILSGPTGSGKSTTLYALVQEIDRTARTVNSVESPVEYDMALVDQINVAEHGTLTMADAVRSLMRHDPDVIVIGEMRDPDTIEAALRAAESGHLVISTVHAVNAHHTLDRITGFLRPDYRDSGLYVLGQALTGVISQRLMRTLCHVCRLETTAHEALGSEAQCRHLGLDPHEILHVANPEGCSLCDGSGFIGRQLVVEALFPPNDQPSRRELTENLVKGDIAYISDMPGSVYTPRQESVLKLMRSGTVDANVGASLILGEVGAAQ